MECTNILEKKQRRIRNPIKRTKMPDFFKSHITITRRLYIPKRLRPAKVEVVEQDGVCRIWLLSSSVQSKDAYACIPLSTAELVNCLTDGEEDVQVSSKSILLRYGLYDADTQTYGWYYQL